LLHKRIEYKSADKRACIRCVFYFGARKAAEICVDDFASLRVGNDWGDPFTETLDILNVNFGVHAMQSEVLQASKVCAALRRFNMFAKDWNRTGRPIK